MVISTADFGTPACLIYAVVRFPWVCEQIITRQPKAIQPKAIQPKDALIGIKGSFLYPLLPWIPSLSLVPALVV